MRAAGPTKKACGDPISVWTRAYKFCVSLLFCVIVLLVLNGALLLSGFVVKKSGLITALSGTASTHKASWEFFSYKSCILPEHYSSYELFHSELMAQEGASLVENVESEALASSGEIAGHSGLPTGKRAGESGAGALAGNVSTGEEEKKHEDDGLVDQIVLIVVDAMRPDYIFPQLSLQGIGKGCGMSRGSDKMAKADSGERSDENDEKTVLGSHRERSAERVFCPVEWNEKLCVVQKATGSAGRGATTNQAALSASNGCGVTPTQILSFIQQHLMDPADPSIGLFSYADYPTSTAQRLASMMSGIIPPLIQAFTENIFVLSPEKDESVKRVERPQHCSPACCGRYRNGGKSWDGESDGADRSGDPPLSAHRNADGDEHRRLVNGTEVCECACRPPSLTRSIFPNTEGVSRDSLPFQLDGRATCIGDDTLTRVFYAVDGKDKVQGESSVNATMQDKAEPKNLFWKEHHGFFSYDVNDFDSIDELVIDKFVDLLYRETPEASGLTTVTLESEKSAMSGSASGSPHAKLLVGHVIGVDHIGHGLWKTVGDEMDLRVRRIDDLLFQISEALSSRNTSMRTLLAVLGDHGTTRIGTHGGDSLPEKGTFAFVKYYPPTNGKYAPTLFSGGERQRPSWETTNHTEGSHIPCKSTPGPLNASSTLPLTAFQQRKLAELIEQRRTENLDKDVGNLLETCLWDQHATTGMKNADTGPDSWGSLSASLSPLFPFPHKVSGSFQIDWAPTMAVLFGVPIPQASAGRVIPEVIALVHYSRWNEAFLPYRRVREETDYRERQAGGDKGNGDEGEDWYEGKLAPATSLEKLSSSSLDWLVNRLEYCNWRQVLKLLKTKDGEVVQKGKDGPGFTDDSPGSTLSRDPLEEAGSAGGSPAYGARWQMGNLENGVGEASGTIDCNDQLLRVVVERGFSSFLRSGRHRYVGYRSYLADAGAQLHASYSVFSNLTAQVLWILMILVVSVAGSARYYHLYKKSASQEGVPSHGRSGSRFFPLPAGFLWFSLIGLKLWIDTQSVDMPFIEDRMLKCLLLMHLVVTGVLLETWEIRPIRCLLFWMGVLVSHVTRRSYGIDTMVVSITPLEEWAGRWWPEMSSTGLWGGWVSFLLSRIFHLPFLVVAVFWWLDMYSRPVCAGYRGWPFPVRMMHLVPRVRRNAEVRRDSEAWSEEKGREGTPYTKKQDLGARSSLDFRDYAPFLVAVIMGIVRDVVVLHYVALAVLVISGPGAFRPRNGRKAGKSVAPNGRSDSDEVGASQKVVMGENEYTRSLQHPVGSHPHHEDSHQSSHALFSKKFRYYMAVMWITSLYDYTADNRTGSIVAALYGCLLPVFFFTFLGQGCRGEVNGGKVPHRVPARGWRFQNYVSLRMPRVLSVISFSAPSTLWLSASLVYLTAMYGFFISGQQCVFSTVDFRASAVGLPSELQLVAALRSPLFSFTMIPEDTLYSVAQSVKLLISGVSLFFRIFYPIFLALPAVEVSGVAIKCKSSSAGCPSSYPQHSSVLNYDNGMNGVTGLRALTEVVLIQSVVYVAGTLLNLHWNYACPYFSSIILVRVVFQFVMMASFFVSVLFTDLNSIPRWLFRLHTRFATIFVPSRKAVPLN